MAEKPFSLRLFEPVLTGSALVRDLSSWANTWTRSIRLQGGYWDGQIIVRGPVGMLIDAFYSWLGYHVSESMGGAVTWEGLVWSLELRAAGMTRRRSYEFLGNYINGRYTDESGIVQTATPASDAQSIARYGRKEELVLLDSYTGSAMTDRLNTQLSLSAWPWARTIGSAPGDAELLIECVGYSWAGNFRYVTSADGNTGNANAWISAILAADCAEWLTAGNIAANAWQVKRQLTMPRRAWDLMSELAEMGDSNYEPWRIYVDTGRLVHYIPVSLSPVYWRRGGIYSLGAGGAAVSPWQVRPGVIRDADYPVSRREQGSPFADARDFLVDEISVSADGEIKARTAAAANESEIMDAQAQADKEARRV